MVNLEGFYLVVLGIFVVKYKYNTIIINCHYFVVLILLLILGCTDLLCSEIRPDSASGAKSDTWKFLVPAALKAQCHIKCHDTKYNSKSLIIQKIITKLPSSVFNHRLNTSSTKYMSLTAVSFRYH